MNDATSGVTIGVPVYNGARFLAQTLDALVAQTYRNIEVIIGDNASTDATPDICREYAARDSRIRYIRHAANGGAAWNINRVAELADREYFKWQMADDLCVPQFIERCVEILDRDPTVVLACARTTFIDENGKVLSTLDPGWDLQALEPHKRLRSVIYAGGHWANADALGGVIRRSALMRTTLLPRYPGGDKRPLAELSLMGRFIEIPDYLCQRRVHAGSSGQNNPEFSQERARAVEWMAEFFKTSRTEVSRPTWHLFLDHVRIIRHARLAMRHKLLLLGAVMRAMRWSWKRLLKELQLA